MSYCLQFWPRQMLFHCYRTSLRDKTGWQKRLLQASLDLLDTFRCRSWYRPVSMYGPSSYAGDLLVAVEVQHSRTTEVSYVQT